MNTNNTDIDNFLELIELEGSNMDEETLDKITEILNEYLIEFENTIDMLQGVSLPTNVGLQLMVENLTSPVSFIPSKDGTGRTFIVDQAGFIKILLPDGKLSNENFMDIRNKITPLNPVYDERGLLGLALHPNFSTNGKFYVYYTVPLMLDSLVFFDKIEFYDHTDIISEFKISQDPNIADMNSEKILLKIAHPQSNHNGGQITFGPDGFFYIPIGDGGAANDIGFGHFPGGNGQNLNTLLGKILRIDIDKPDTNRKTLYSIPPDNPFISGESQPEIYAYGLRNPWHIAFDSGGNRELFAGDAGQNLWEEIDIITKGSNYGWNIREGTHCFDPVNAFVSPPSCPTTGPKGEPLKDPIIELKNRNQGSEYPVVIIGGYVYRGNNIPQFNGSYIFGGYSREINKPDGNLYIATPPTPTEKLWPIKELTISNSPNGRINAYVLSFGQDENNEIYALTREMSGPTGNTGKIFKIMPSTGIASSSTGKSSMVAQKTPATPGTQITYPSPVNTDKVEIKNFAFIPSNISISKGTTVTWAQNEPGNILHTVTSDTKIWDSGILNPGQTFSRIFDKIGTFPYHCEIHPFMKAVVSVS